jgi:bacterial/archaeal transporter family protein
VTHPGGPNCPSRGRNLLRLSWLFYSLSTVVLFALWSVLGKIALRTATPVQTTLLYGLAGVAIALAAIAIGQRTNGWSVSTLWVGVVSALCGGLGLMTFYLALDRGKASLAVPIVGFYPALVAVLSVAFLDERLSALQVAGIVLAIAGVALIGAG